MKLEVETLYIFLFRFILAIAIFLPLLPSTGGFASYDVRFVFVPIALGIIFLFRKVSSLRLFYSYSILFILLEIVLLISFAINEGDIKVTNLVTGFLPLTMLMYILMFDVLTMGIGHSINYASFLEKNYNFFRLLISLMFTYGIFEVLYPDNNLIYALYKRESLVFLQDFATTFFGTTYTSSFSFFTLFILAFPLAKDHLSKILLIVLLLVFSIISGSKAMLVTSVIYLVLFRFFLMKNTHVILPFILIFAGFIGVASWSLFIDMLYYFSDIKVANGLYKVLTNDADTGTFSVRLEQVIFAYNSTLEHFLLGSGTGEGIYLESWLANIIYLYGLIGLLFFIVAYVYVCIQLFNVMILLTNIKKRITASLLIWFILLPLSQFSSLMIFDGKVAVISMLVFCLIAKAMYFSDKDEYEPSH